MKRRESVLWLAAIGIGAVIPHAASQQAKSRRIGILLPNPSPSLEGAFRKRLASLGWVEGRDFIIDSRHAGNRNEQLAALALALVEEKVEVIVTSSTPGALAAMAASTTIPIVFANVADPVRSKIVGNLARPGGNVTGITNLAGELLLKQFELLKALIPKLDRVAFMGDPSIPGQKMFETLHAAAEKHGVTVLRLGASTLAEIDLAFETNGAIVAPRLASLSTQ